MKAEWVDERVCDDPWEDPTGTPCGQCEGCLGL